LKATAEGTLQEKKKRNLPYIGKKPNPESGNQGRHGEPFLEYFLH